MRDGEALVATPASQEGLVNPFAPPVGPAAIVIFGAVGDLARKKLLPALHNLDEANLLGEGIAIVGVGRADLDDRKFREQLREDLRVSIGEDFDARVAQRILSSAHYLNGTFEDPATFERLGKLLGRVEKENGTRGNVLFYLSTAPEFFGTIVEMLGLAGLTAEEGGRWRRVIVEKPFGCDLESARKLNAKLRRTLEERQIWRIDHYLGKETVQNLLVFRFGNGMFEPIWNRRYIDNVQITVAESNGVDLRGGYYDRAGALRDMVPNHLLQLLSLVAMEPPTSFEAESVREEKSKVLRAIQPLTSERVLTQVVRGQYGAGHVGGESVPAYRAEARIAKDSATETFVALKLFVENWRWADVPFYLRTGKRMSRRVSEISIQFRRPPLRLFRDTAVENLSRNVLVVRIQPEEGISLRFGAKIPGPAVRVGNVAMNFCYEDVFGTKPSTGYETLLYDAIQGDATLYQRADTIEAGWSVVEPILESWRARPSDAFPNYAAGSFGPRESDDMLERDGRRWRRIEE